ELQLMTKQQSPNVREIVGAHLWKMRRSLATALLCIFGFTLTELLAPWPLKIIFDYILLGKPLPPSLLWLGGLMAQGRTVAVIVVSLNIVLIAAGKSLFDYFQFYQTSRVGHQMVHILRRELFSHLQGLSLYFHNRARSGALLNRVTTETEVLKDTFAESVMTASSQLLTVSGMFVIMFLLNWKLALVAAATLPILFYALASIYQKLKVNARKQRESEGLIAARLSEVLTSVPLVKAYGRERYEQERFDAESAISLEQGIEAERLAAAAMRSLELIKAAGLWVIVLFGALMALRSEMTPGDVLVFTAYLADMYKQLRNLAKLSTRYSRAMVSVQRMQEIFETEPESRDDVSAVEAPRLKGEIIFNHVSFDYGNGRKVLDDVSFTIAPGQRVALVGPSGSGKSTVASLLLRFYDARSGEIRIDGVDIKRYSRESLRREIGIVLQDSILFGASVRENIAYGKPDASLEEVIDAARQAHAHDFIAALPEGYDTIIGERGATLSGGQRQRVCLARAIIKRPSALILDEPTSAVDAESAALIHDALERLQQGKTTIVIAHNFTAMEKFDQILVLKNNRVLEHGTHQRLLEQKGRYYRLYQRQARNEYCP
ncbi:MAG TPA: ABC transporter ATP-binding protein, partial [Blastocatellia bacterium]|nr:ABC transporter ATP-binding protein [Blastocatellia bacterium]